MHTEADICRKLEEALTTSCSDALYFSDNETQLIESEHLLTINAAQAIKELNRYFGEPYKIHLEHCTRKFSTACTPLMKKVPARNSRGYQTILPRGRNDTTRSGKIDITVYETSNAFKNRPICAIEIKGFNPSKKLILADLIRNSEYFGLSSSTGSSDPPFTVFMALHSYKGVWNDEKEARNIDKVTSRYRNYIKNNLKLNQLSHDIKAKTIRRGTLPDANDPHVQEFGLEGDEDYHFVGIMVTTTRKI